MAARKKRQDIVHLHRFPSSGIKQDVGPIRDAKTSDFPELMVLISRSHLTWSYSKNSLNISLWAITGQCASALMYISRRHRLVRARTSHKFNTFLYRKPHAHLCSMNDGLFVKKKFFSGKGSRPSKSASENMRTSCDMSLAISIEQHLHFLTFLIHLSLERLKVPVSLGYIPLSSSGIHTKHILSKFRREAH